MAAKFSYPFVLPTRASCQQYDYENSKLGSTACTTHVGNGWFTFVGIFTIKASEIFEIIENNNLYNPDFEFKHTPGGNNKSPLYNFVWYEGILKKYSVIYLSPTRGTAYVSLHTSSATNPVSATLDYDLGVFIRTRTRLFKYL